ncbi:MAG: glycosyltransferase family 39 protein [Rhodobacteraceae bacterium]|nr:glycosyltransferase family 39 protein [Paracoccaceae bacterium]
MPDSPLPPRPDRRERLALAAILLLALALRVPGLNSGLWYDEISTLIKYVRLPTGTLLTTYDSLNNHMFFSLQAQAASALFGEAPWSLRLPAMLFGVASVWALWRLAREVVSPTQALLAALLMTVSYHHVWFSQNARGYTGLLFFGLIASLALLRGTRTNSWGAWVAYGLCFAAAMFTHLSAAFLFFGQGLAYLAVLVGRVLRGRGLSIAEVLRPLAGIGLGAVIVLLLYLPVLGQMSDTFAGVQSGPDDALRADSIAEWKSPLWTLAEMLRGLGPVLGLATPVILLVLAVAGIALWSRAAILPLSLIAHLGGTLGLLVLLGFRVWPRYFLVDLGLICLFLIHGAFRIGAAVGPRVGLTEHRSGVILAGFGIAASLVLLPTNYRYPKQDFPAAVAYVDAHRQDGAKVLALGLSALPFSFYAPDWTPVETLTEFEAAFDPAQETWLVYTFPKVLKRRHADILSAPGTEFVEEHYFHGTLVDGGIVVLRHPGHP